MAAIAKTPVPLQRSPVGQSPCPKAAAASSQEGEVHESRWADFLTTCGAKHHWNSNWRVTLRLAVAFGLAALSLAVLSVVPWYAMVVGWIGLGTAMFLGNSVVTSCAFGTFSESEWLNVSVPRKRTPPCCCLPCPSLPLLAPATAALHLPTLPAITVFFSSPLSPRDAASHTCLLLRYASQNVVGLVCGLPLLVSYSSLRQKAGDTRTAVSKLANVSAVCSCALAMFLASGARWRYAKGRVYCLASCCAPRCAIRHTVVPLVAVQLR